MSETRVLRGNFFSVSEIQQNAAKTGRAMRFPGFGQRLRLGPWADPPDSCSARTIDRTARPSHDSKLERSRLLPHSSRLFHYRRVAKFTLSLVEFLPPAGGASPRFPFRCPGLASVMEADSVPPVLGHALWNLGVGGVFIFKRRSAARINRCSCVASRNVWAHFVGGGRSIKKQGFRSVAWVPPAMYRTGVAALLGKLCSK